MGPLYEFEDVHYSYPAAGVRDTPEVLGGLSFAVAEGEYVALMGPSGSGKSTVLGLLEGFLRPNSGRVLFRGSDLASLDPEGLRRYRNLEVGMVFQFFNLVPRMSSLDNVAFPAVVAGASRAQAREKARALLADVGLEGLEPKKPIELSGGQQQRVAIARALVNGPGVVLADEPTGNLDRASTGTICELFRRVHEERGVGLVVVTHDEAVARTADRIIEL